MTCTITVDGPCRRTLSFSIERATLERVLDERVKEVAQTQRFKGFRAGKAPLALVRKTHGPALAEEVRRRVIGKAFAEAVREHELRPVGDPELNLKELQDEAAGPFTFEFSIEVAPEIELRIEAPIPVTVALPDVGETMVESEVQRLRRQAARLEDAEAGMLIGPKDVLEGALAIVVDGAELETRAGRAVLLEHDLVDGIRIEGAARSFAASQIGDTVELSTTLPPHFEPAQHAGKAATLRFTIERHRLVVLPELDATLLEKIGVASEDELRGHIRAGLEAQRRSVREQLVDREVERHLLATHEFALPERLVAKNVEHRVHEYAHRLMERDGLSSEDGHHAAEDKRAEITATSHDGLRMAFLMAQIALDNQLMASTADAENQVRALARQQKSDPEEAVAASRREGWLLDVQEQLTQQNARRWLRERAQVTETRPAPGPAPAAGAAVTTGARGPQPEGP